ncbi:ATP-dependent DNA helicase PIF1-like [Aphis craccivora]|uniref:ATP-dependent DNA helicase n=1 Tax=Aphis craccivora TaxID=307492 RepID=A0A6G0X086_APHCR|nr:ATP-dependent DNA helicase PIF1-like [Aphis craccivora]
MIRQLEKPTMILNLSASKYEWNDLLRLLYRLQNNGREWEREDLAETLMSGDLRTKMANEDPVASNDGSEDDEQYFHLWISKILRSNTGIQYILEEYSCAPNVVEYVNKTNRGISDLNRELSKLRNEYPNLDFAQLAIKAGAAWYLLNLHMSETSSKCEYIQTTWPHERHRVRKSLARMQNKELSEDSTEVCAVRRMVRVIPKRRLETSFKTHNHSIQVDILNQHWYRTLYEQHETEITEARKEYEARIDIEAVLAEYSGTRRSERRHVGKIMEHMSAVVWKRENTLTVEEYCGLMFHTNMQRDLVLEVIHGIFIDGERESLKIFFTGPEGCGKKFTMIAMTETYNRFSRTRNNIYNAFVMTASAGVTAAALGGTTVHSAFRISNNPNAGGLKTETLQSFPRSLRRHMGSTYRLMQPSSATARLQTNIAEFQGRFDMANARLPSTLTGHASFEHYVLTKIGKGGKLTDDECEYLEHRFIYRASIKIGKILRSKVVGYYVAYPCIDTRWSPIALRSSTITLPSKNISCKRTTFPLTLACAISIHKSQGSTYLAVVYEYSKTHNQQILYVALSRCSKYGGLFLTNRSGDYRFYHKHKKELKEIRTEFERLARHMCRSHVPLEPDMYPTGTAVGCREVMTCLRVAPLFFLFSPENNRYVEKYVSPTSAMPNVIEGFQAERKNGCTTTSLTLKKI